MKRIVLTLLLVSAAVLSLAQNLPVQEETLVIPYTEKGYYIKNGSVFHVNINQENDLMRTKRIIVPEQHNHKYTLFTPADISEYGFPNRARFISAKIKTGDSEEWVFLEQLQQINDTLSILYLYRESSIQDEYFILNKGKAGRIATGSEPEKMWQFMATFNGCEGTDERIIYPSTLRKNMVRRYYHASRYCNMKLFPQKKFGFTAAVGIGRPKVFDEQRLTLDDTFIYNFRYGPMVSLGIFARIPFDEVVSLQLDVNYFYMPNSGVTGFGDNSNVNAYSRHNAVRVPLLVRFNNNYARGNWMPYAELGPCVNIDFYSYYWNDSYTSAQWVPVMAYGFTLGVGAEYYVSPGRSFYVGLRYSGMSDLKRNKRRTLAVWEIAAGFSIFNW